MPYNTRRKSLSLPSLGIQLPNGSRAHRPSLSKPVNVPETPQPPTKKIKRSHSSSSPSPVSSSRPRSSTSCITKNVSFAERPKSRGRAAYDNTPPPSPGAAGSTKVDLDDINDDIVVGVIEQLEKTGNRPHLVKELATVLSTTNDSVLGSANPSALLSSRLAAYLRRPDWSPLSPCPLGKELIPIHPRKVFYFLTTSPRQEISTNSSNATTSNLIGNLGPGRNGGTRIISPSLSSASTDGDAENGEERKREALSPSPEVDLSALDFDIDAPGIEADFNAPITPGGPSFSERSSLARDGSNGSEGMNLIHNHRSVSPPLEGDEKEFTQTASDMRMRGMSLDDLNVRESTETAHPADDPADMHMDESEEERAQRSREAAAALFGDQHGNGHEGSMGLLSSPMVKPMQLHGSMSRERRECTVDVDMRSSTSILGESRFGGGWEPVDPENIDLDELDDLLGGF